MSPRAKKAGRRRAPPAADRLGRLRDPRSGALDRLVGAFLDDLLARRVGELVDARLGAETLRDAVAILARSPAAELRIARAWDEAATRLGHERRRLGEVLPPGLEQLLRESASRPHTPDRALVLAVLDREPVRALVRELLFDALLAFGRRLRSPVAENPLARGLGGLSRIAREQVKARTGALGAMASDMADYVSGEVERQLERRASEFTDTALSGVMQRLADQMCDPGRAKEQAALRTALLEGMLDLRGDQVSRELARRSGPEIGRTVRAALERFAARPDAAEELVPLVEALLERDAKRTLGEVLDELGLRAPFLASSRELARRRLQPFVETDAFAAWWDELHEDGG